jgi:flagellar basal body rod protein FlgC
MKNLFTSVLLCPTMLYANCANIEKYAAAIEIHASNFNNQNTTRTPRGGAYKFKTLKCKGTCKVVEEERFISKYEPDHPDAKANGYVEYPIINPEHERAAIGSYAKLIHLKSTKCNLKVTSVSHSDSLLLNYLNSEVKHDAFNFDKSNKVISWIRETRDGKTQILNF